MFIVVLKTVIYHAEYKFSRLIFVMSLTIINCRETFVRNCMSYSYIKLYTLLQPNEKGYFWKVGFGISVFFLTLVRAGKAIGWSEVMTAVELENDIYPNLFIYLFILNLILDGSCKRGQLNY